MVGKLMGQMSEQKALPTYETKIEDGSVWVDLLQVVSGLLAEGYQSAL